MILAIALMLMTGLHPSHGPITDLSSPVAIRPSVVLSALPLALSAIDSDSDLPHKEYGLPDGSRESENEEEDGDEGELVGAQFGLPTFHRPSPTSAGIAVANRWFLGLGPEARVPYLRC